MTEKVKILKVRCPRCGERVAYQDNPYRPFCSEKCRLIDLGRWAEGEFRIPGAPAAPTEPEDDEF